MDSENGTDSDDSFYSALSDVARTTHADAVLSVSSSSRGALAGTSLAGASSRISARSVVSARSTQQPPVPSAPPLALPRRRGASRGPSAQSAPPAPPPASHLSTRSPPRWTALFSPRTAEDGPAMAPAPSAHAEEENGLDDWGDDFDSDDDGDDGLAQDAGFVSRAESVAGSNIGGASVGLASEGDLLTTSRDGLRSNQLASFVAGAGLASAEAERMPARPAGDGLALSSVMGATTSFSRGPSDSTRLSSAPVGPAVVQVGSNAKSMDRKDQGRLNAGALYLSGSIAADSSGSVLASSGPGLSADSYPPGESLRLRASGFDSATPPLARAPEATGGALGSVIGIYADPTAEKDDWADDFQLDSRERDGLEEARHAEADHGSRASDARMTAVLSLLLEQPRDRDGAGRDAEREATRKRERTRPSQIQAVPSGTVSSRASPFKPGVGDMEDEFHSVEGTAETERDDVASVSATVPSEMSLAGAAMRASVAPNQHHHHYGGAGSVKLAPDPVVPASRVVLSVTYGDEQGEVHPSCHRFLDLWGRHLGAIEEHLESLRKDRGSMHALESAAVSVYSFTNDADVGKLLSSHGSQVSNRGEMTTYADGVAGKDLSSTARSRLKLDHRRFPDEDAVVRHGPMEDPAAAHSSSAAFCCIARDVLQWKLEYAKLLNDTLAAVQSLIALARFERDYGVVQYAFEVLSRAQHQLDELKASDIDQVIATLRIEMQYELALTWQRSGELDSAVETFSRAADMSMVLASRDGVQDPCDSSEQRGLWWGQECKYMLAESLYEQGRFAEAVRHYVEYATQAIARMIGLIVPGRPDQATAGTELMRYCLFTPRRLALCVWSAALCLASLGIVEIAQKVGNVAMRTATALGIEDVRVATVDFCGRVKVTLKEARRRQAASHGPSDATNTGALGEGGHGIASDSGRDVASSQRDHLAEGEDENDLDDPFGLVEEDWDAQIERDYKITIQRCSEVTGAHGEALFSGIENTGDMHEDAARAPVNAKSGNSDGSTALAEGGVSVAGGALVSTAFGSQGRHDRRSTRAAGSNVSWAVSRSNGGDVGRNVFLASSNNLTESELRQYLNRLNAAVVNMTSQQMFYPKPTESYFQSPAFGPKEHEAFLRNFVRGRIEEASSRTMPFEVRLSARGSSIASRAKSEMSSPPRARFSMHSRMNSSLSCNASFVDTDIVRECVGRVRDLDRGSLPFVRVHQEAIWSVCRSHSTLRKKRDEIRTLVNSAFSDHAASGVAASPASIILDADSQAERLAIIGSLLECLKLARDVLSPDGKDGAWFTRASNVLMATATTVSPAAKAAVELFRAESRAHCGVVRVTAPAVLDLCTGGISGPASSPQTQLGTGSSASSIIGSGASLSAAGAPAPGAQNATASKDFPHVVGAAVVSVSDRSPSIKQANPVVDLRVPDDLRVSVVDVMHSLYWRTKAGVDDSNTQADALERLVHADVSATLYLVGSGVSPISGAALDIAKDESILNLSRRRSGLIDDTRRAKDDELVADLRSMWSGLPDTASHVRARVCLALARHARYELQDSAVAERLLFDGLLYVDKATPSDPMGQMPRPSLCLSTHVCPLAAVSCPLVCALLYEYGAVSLSRGKYRYGIAAMEASADGLKARDPDNAFSLAASEEIASVALSRHDWRRALTWLHDMRASVHPANGRRNAFVHLCLVLHEICRDVGCFDAADVPLRAISTLLFEEKLRTLLVRYRTRLAKKARARRRIKVATAVLPSAFPRSRSVAVGRGGASAGWDRRYTTRRVFSFQQDPSGGQAVDSDGPSSLERRLSAVASPSAAKSNSWSARATRLFAGIAKRSSIRPTAAAAAAAAAVARSPSRGFEKRYGRSRSHAEVPDAFCNPPEDVHTATRRRRGRSVGAASSRNTELSERQANGSDDEREDLFAIAEEQAAVADSELFEVEMLRVRSAFDRGAYAEAEEMCRSLLDMLLPMHGSRYYVLEVLARIRLKRREITRCLEVIEQMEQEASLSSPHAVLRDFTVSRASHRHSVSGTRLHSQFAGKGTDRESLYMPQTENESVVNVLRMDGERAVRGFLPEVAFLRLSALLHGGRLNEALTYANQALNVCPEDQLWHRAKLHYVRGKVVFSMCSSATAPFDSEEVAAGASTPISSVVDAGLVELALSAFEIASGYFDAAGDEVGVVKSDLRWCQTVIDVLFRRIVLPRLAGDDSMELQTACQFGERFIALPEVEDVVLSTLSFLSAANLPLVTIDALAALAEVKCIAGESSTAWSFWVSEAWKLFSRLLTDPEEYKVVLSSVAPVSTLMRLKNLCGRLVRLILCSSHTADVESINRHLGIFEAYVTLQIDIDRQMNLASSVHASKDSVDADGSPFTHLNGSTPRGGSATDGQEVQGARDRDTTLRTENGVSNLNEPNISSSGIQGVSPPSDNRAVAEEGGGRPAGAFLHILEDESLALGRQGLSVIVNRPGQQVVNAIKETGAVLVPRTWYASRRRQKETATSRAYKRNLDAEYIFPFNDMPGLGAMYILDDATVEEAEGTGVSTFDGSSSPDFAVRTLDFDELMAESSTDRQRSDGISESPTRQPHVAVERESQRVDSSTGRSTSSPRQQQQASGGPYRRPSPLSILLDAVRGLHDGSAKEHSCLGDSIAENVWAHMHRLKVETKRYSRGEITVEEMGQRNGATLRSWLLCVPRSRREWSVPDAVGKRLVYILYAHGVIGYYSVDRGSCVSRLEFGGKQIYSETHASDAAGNAQAGGVNPSSQAPPSVGARLSGSQSSPHPRPPNNAERKFLYGLVKDWKARGNTWFKDRESEIVTGLATGVLRTPRVLLETRDALLRGKTQKNRRIVLIADLTLQVFPWELFLDHVVIRSLSLLDAIRGLQDETFQRYNQQALQEAMLFPTVALNRSIVRFINFASPRREGGDLERSEEARRQQLAFQALLRLNHLSPPRLIACLGLGGFSDPTALNAVARPTGPLSTPLTQSTKAVNVLGVRLEARVGRKNYARLDFVKVPGLGSASTADLREASLISVVQKKSRPNERDVVRREVGAYIAVFLFTYADLVDVTESVFGLLKAMPRGILIFAPATKMKVVVRHLEDEELDAELQQASGRRNGRIVPDIGASTRVIVEYVSRFARSKLIPIVVFLGEGLADVWPRGGKRGRARSGVARAQHGGAGQHVQRGAGAPHPQQLAAERTGGRVL